MKRIALFFAVAFIACTMTSCVKTWTCTCDQLVSGGTQSVTVGTYKTTKKLAKTSCELNNSTSSYGGYSNCAIK